ncbi:MAG TPA: site-2 protease family protein [Acidobacteriaceae bacterium]|nr:site-2 protease family protein [Acidobacteriaceae bacterium]
MPTTADRPLLPGPVDEWETGLGRRRRIAWVPLCLLVVSLITTASTGALLMQNFRLGEPPLVNEGDLFPLHWIWEHLSALGSGWSFSLALLGILLSHEAGHLFFCRRHKIRASWPYVLPAPTLSGTAGAVIRIRSRIPSRRALLEVGIAGPIAGYVVALFTTVLGLLLSKPAGAGTHAALVQFRQPLTIALLDRGLRLVFPWVPTLDNMIPHPILIASWVGLFVTSLNLIPAGQLDGGHILYAISARWHRALTIVVPVILLVMGVMLWTGWVLWGVILLLPAMRHPHVPYFPLMPYNYRWLCLVAMAILALTFLPAPFVGTSVMDLFR